MIPLFALVMVRPDGGGGCNPPVPHDGRIGVAGHSNGRGVLVEEIGVGTPADGAIEPGDVIVAIDGVELSGPRAFHELRRRARGPRGTEVELAVEGESGPRTVELVRAFVDDDVARRGVPREREGCPSGGWPGPDWR